MSIKQNLTGKQYVQGDSKYKILQSYHIDYYPPEEGYPTDKIWLHLDGEENKKPRVIWSLCFKNVENYKNFIYNNIYSYLFWLEKKGIEFKPKEMLISTFRMALLNDLLIKIREEIPKKFQASGVYQPR